MSHPLECPPGADAEYLETIALLQDEVARLEQERDRRGRGSPEPEADGPDTSSDEAVAAGEMAAAARAEVARLEAELAGREETIGLLLEHLGLVEEAHAAGLAEREQLAGWLAELERRVEGRDGDAMLRLEERLASLQHQADDSRRAAERDRRAAEAQRQAHEAEIARLRAALVAHRAETNADGDRDSETIDEIQTLREENLRLRATLEARAEPPPGEAIEERDELRRRLEQLQDERRREQIEHGASMAELQAQLSRAALVRPETDPDEAGAGPAIPRARDEQLRFQALRQHLREIHAREEQERRQKPLIPRLSRLWSRTGPR